MAVSVGWGGAERGGSWGRYHCYGSWLPLPPTGLAYCRHLSTVRTHLSALVRHHIIPPARPPGASGGLTKDVWSKYQKDEKVHTLGSQGRRLGQGAGGVRGSSSE